MSDFFSDIYQGAQEPDVVMNRGPLPPTSSAGMPPGFDGTADARIDYGSTLLGDLDPYAYGEPGRPGTQAAYLNVPHVAQRIVPQINLPESQPHNAGGSFFGLNHQVDDGDVAFVIRAMFSPYELVEDKNKYSRQGVLYAIDPVVNLATVNYILHGLQRYGFDRNGAKNWNSLWVALGIDTHFGKHLGVAMQKCEADLVALNSAQPRTKKDVLSRYTHCMSMGHMRRMVASYIIGHVIKPFGVPRGSEKQGGQHQGIVNKAVTWPVDLVTAMVIDGKVINLVNFWRQDNISAGDDLLLYLEERKYTDYVLSHHPKSRKTQCFPPLRKWELPRAVVESDRVSDRASRAFKRLWGIIPGLDLKAAQSVEAEPFGDMTDAERSAAWNGAIGASVTPEEAQYEIARALIAMQPHEIDANITREGTPLNTILAMRAAISQFERVGDLGARSEPTLVCESIFQLVPGVSSSCKNGVMEAIWKYGYWHIARSQIMQFCYDNSVDVPNGAHTVASGKLLEATFSPVWMNPLEVDTMSENSSVESTFARDGGGGSGLDLICDCMRSKVSDMVQSVLALKAVIRGNFANTLSTENACKNTELSLKLIEKARVLQQEYADSQSMLDRCTSHSGVLLRTTLKELPPATSLLTAWSFLGRAAVHTSVRTYICEHITEGFLIELFESLSPPRPDGSDSTVLGTIAAAATVMLGVTEGLGLPGMDWGFLTDQRLAVRAAELSDVVYAAHQGIPYNGATETRESRLSHVIRTLSVCMAMDVSGRALADKGFDRTLAKPLLEATAKSVLQSSINGEPSLDLDPVYTAQLARLAGTKASHRICQDTYRKGLVHTENAIEMQFSILTATTSHIFLSISNPAELPYSDGRAYVAPTAAAIGVISGKQQRRVEMACEYFATRRGVVAGTLQHPVLREILLYHIAGHIALLSVAQDDLARVVGLDAIIRTQIRHCRQNSVHAIVNPYFQNGMSLFDREFGSGAHQVDAYRSGIAGYLRLNNGTDETGSAVMNHMNPVHDPMEVAMGEDISMQDSGTKSKKGRGTEADVQKKKKVRSESMEAPITGDVLMQEDHSPDYDTQAQSRFKKVSAKNL